MLVAALSGGLVASSAWAQPAGSGEGEGASRQMNVHDAALLRAVRGIAGQVESLRGERFTKPVEAARTPEDMLEIAAAIRALGADDRERLAARGRAWADLGFGAVTAPEALLKVLAADLSGVAVDFGASRLLIGPDVLGDDDFAARDGSDPVAALLLAGVRPDAPLVAHSLMHLRQYERDPRASRGPTTDELLARAAWAEGEANLLAVRYLFSGLSLQEDAIDAGLDPGQYLEGRLVPGAISGVSGVEVDLLRFVYLEGYAQAVERFRLGHWERVTSDMRRERTTREVLHQGAPRLDTSFPAPRAPAEGLVLADEDSLGEQGVLTWVSRLTGKDNLAVQAAEGWAGDRLYRWESGTAGVTEWVTRWASAEDVEDFDYALGRAMGVRFRGVAPVTVAEGIRTYTTVDRVFRVERRGLTVRLLATPPALAGVRAAGDPAAD